MKTIKSVLIGALVALLGSSAWAASAKPSTVDEVYVGGTVSVEITGDSGSSRTVAFAKSSSSGQTAWENDYISVKLASSTIPKSGSGTVAMTITGKKATMTKQTITLYRTGRDTAWLTVTVAKVTEPKFVDHGEVSIAIPPEGSQVMTATSAAAADWTVWSDNEHVATVDFKGSSAKEATFTITAKGEEGEMTTCVASNKYSKWTYKVGIDSHTVIDRKEISFASGATEKWTTFTCEKGKTDWYAWTDRPGLVKVKIESADPKGPLTAVRPTDPKDYSKVTGAESVKLTITHELTNPSGTAMVYVQADGDNICHEVKAVCDVVNCVYVPLKHSDDGEDPDSWYEIPEDWVKPAEDATDDERTWGFDYAASSDKEIAEIKVKDGKFYLHAPADGRDGETRVVFVKSETGVIDDGDKIWMFYASVSTVEVEKFLTFPEGFDSDKEALLNIRAHYLNNVKEEPTPKVLFVVTGCNSHDLNRDKVCATVSNVCQRADVDFYLFKPGQSVNDVTMRTVEKGKKTVTNTDLGMTSDFGGNQHSCLNGFYSLFYKLAKDPAKRYYYDYIVMEFDSQRLAAQDHDFNDRYEANPEGSPNREVVVAEWLNEYYEGIKDSAGARIVWVVDDMMNKSDQRDPRRTGSWPTSAGTTPDGHPYKAYDMLWGSEDADEYFRPFQEHITGGGQRERSFTGSTSYTDDSGANLAMPDNRYAALLGLLNPWKYLAARFDKATAADLAARLDSVTEKHTYRIGGADPSYDREVRVGDTYKWQAYYDDQKGLINFLNEHLVFTTYAARITDNIETQGLAFVEGTWKTFGSYNKAANTSSNSTDTTGGKAIWTELAAMGTDDMPATGTVWTADHSITGVVGNLTREFWNLVQVKIEDADGSFRLGATRIPGANKSSRDPNLNTNIVDGVYVDTTNGEAAVAYFYDISNPDDGVDAEATTTWDWEFDFLPITLNAKGVTRVYDGTPTNATYTVDPSDAEIKVSYSNDVEKIWTAFETYNENEFTDVTNVWVRFAATRDGYAAATSTPVQVQITPRTVYLQAGTTTNAYDAAELTDESYTKLELAQAKAAGYKGADNAYDFVSGEGISLVTMTSDSKVTNVADCPKANEIDTVTLNDGTKACNYTIEKLAGELVVTPLTITVTADNKSKTYGAADPAFTWTLTPGVVPAADTDTVNSKLNESSITRLDYPSASGKNKAGTYENVLSSNGIFKVNANYIVNFVPGKFTIEPGQLKLTLKNSTTVYDGEAHKIGVEINVTNDLDSAREIAVRFSTNNRDWTDWTDFDDFDSVLPKGTNVADSATIYVQATNILKTSLLMATALTPAFTANANGNYKWTSYSAVLKITKRPITLKSPTKSCNYDEVPLTFDGTEITDTTAGQTGKGYVTGETFVYSNFASNSKPGTSKSATFNYADSTALKGNYDVTVKKGTLTVRPKPAPKSDCSYIPLPPKASDGWAYRWKFTGKTTKAVRTTCASTAVITRMGTSLKIQGWSFYCDPKCGDFEAVKADEIFWSTKPGKVLFSADSGLEFELANIIGKKGKDYEAAGFASFEAADAKDPTAYAFRFAGSGKYDSKNARMTSMKGNFAGFAAAPLLTNGKPGDCGYGTSVSKVWECCGCPTLDAASVVYGKWTVRYDKSKAKKYGASTLEAEKLLPSWAR